MSKVANPEHSRHKFWKQLDEEAAGACAFCSGAFGATEGAEAAGVKLLTGFEDDPSLSSYVTGGYQVKTF